MARILIRGIAAGLTEQQLAAKTPKSLPGGVAIDPKIVSAVYADIVGAGPVQGAPQNLAKQLANCGP